MKLSINYETLGFLVPSSISAKMESTDQLVTLGLDQLDSYEIATLCDEFTSKVFKMANKVPPPRPAPPIAFTPVFQGYVVDSNGLQIKVFSQDGASVYSPNYFLTVDDEKLFKIPQVPPQYTPAPSAPNPVLPPYVIPDLTSQMADFERAVDTKGRPERVGYQKNEKEYLNGFTAAAFFGWQLAKGYL